GRQFVNTGQRSLGSGRHDALSLALADTGQGGQLSDSGGVHVHARGRQPLLSHARLLEVGVVQRGVGGQGDENGRKQGQRRDFAGVQAMPWAFRRVHGGSVARRAAQAKVLIAHVSEKG